MTTPATEKTPRPEEEVLTRAPLDERNIDDALDDSFPASDPPSWWAGADR